MNHEQISDGRDVLLQKKPTKKVIEISKIHVLLLSSRSSGVYQQGIKIQLIQEKLPQALQQNANGIWHILPASFNVFFSGLFDGSQPTFLSK